LEPVAAFDRFMERHRVVKRLALAYLVFGGARMVFVLAFRFDLIHNSPLARFASRLVG
jgi:predicted tellurium resistance membrane protein TerC